MENCVLLRLPPETEIEGWVGDDNYYQRFAGTAANARQKALEAFSRTQAKSAWLKWDCTACLPSGILLTLHCSGDFRIHPWEVLGVSFASPSEYDWVGDEGKRVAIVKHFEQVLRDLKAAMGVTHA